MSALIPKLAAFLDAHKLGVLATVSAEGRPRQSLVYYARDGDRLLIMTEAGRWKVRDAERTGWASICVSGDEPPYPSATLAGPAVVLREDIGSATARIAQNVMGLDEPTLPQTAERVILAITIERVGPVTYIDTESTPPRQPVGLTPREREVVSLLALGRTTADIAAQLGIGSATVETHVQNAMAKTGARTRAHLVAIGLANQTVRAANTTTP